MQSVIDGLLDALFQLEPAPSLAELTGAFGSDPSDAIADAESAGLVTSWEAGDGPTVLPSPLAMSARGLQLVELREDRYVWRPAAFNSPPWKSPRVHSEAVEIVMANLTSPEIEPLDSLVRAEATEKHERKERRRLAGNPNAPKDPHVPKPHHFLGTSIVWAGPIGKGKPCYVCIGRELGPSDYCLLCGRFGLDHLLPRLPKVYVPKPPKQTTAKLTRAERRKAFQAVA